MTARLARVRAGLYARRDDTCIAEASLLRAGEALAGDALRARADRPRARPPAAARGPPPRCGGTARPGPRRALGLHARPALERCLRELEACGLTPVKRREGADRSRLTPQERSVARLVASGLSNREAAAELLLSVKTVERHLTHSYRKLGVSTRAELAAALDAAG